MQKLLSVVVLASMFSITAVSAADLSGSTSGTAATTVVAPIATAIPDLTAAPNPAAVTTAVSASMGSSLGEYKTVACTTNPAFATNSCDQCFI